MKKLDSSSAWRAIHLIGEFVRDHRLPLSPSSAQISENQRLNFCRFSGSSEPEKYLQRKPIAELAALSSRLSTLSSQLKLAVNRFASDEKGPAQAPTLHPKAQRWAYGDS